MQKILDNIKHLPSTLPGAVIALASWIVANSATLQQLAGSNPVAAAYAVKISGAAAGILMIVGVGAKKEPS